jgi:predicted nuclease with TOPRIM domain
MSEEVKFTEEELKQVKGIQDSYFDIQNQFGQTSLAKLRLDEQMENVLKSEDDLRTKFEEIQSNERDFLNGITEKYGEGSLNPETGVFTKNK